jgi:hypothetical protein
MPLLGENLDYTDKDFDSLRARLINLVHGAFPEWTDFNVANFGNILLELFAFVGDVLLYYQDNQAREAFIGTAQLRRSMLALSKLLGYTPSGNTAATVDLTFTLAEPPAAPVTIQARDAFLTLEVTDPVRFEAVGEVVIPAGATPPSVIFTVEHSRLEQDIYASDDTPNQEFQLLRTPFLADSADVSASDGAYTRVDDFLDSTATDKHYTVIVDENDRATVRFGNGVNGSIPTGTISAYYKTGGGTEGNVLPGTIRRVERSYTDSFGAVQTVTVTNEEAATGGSDREKVEAIRVLAPRSVRTLNRTVSREDYETNALRVPGVARAFMATSNEKIGVPENQGELYIIPEGGGLPSQALKDDVYEMVTETYPNTLTFIVQVLDPVVTYVDIVCMVFLASGATAQDVDLAIRANLAKFFALDDDYGAPNPNIGFGFQINNEVAYSDIYNAIRDTEGVRKMSDAPGALQINGESNDLEVDPHAFPALRYVTIYDGDTGYQLVQYST